MIALDTETTGLWPFHGCRPFFVSTCTSDGNLDHQWEWDVNPLTREVVIPKKGPRSLRSLQEFIYSDPTGLVLHNAKFDLHGLKLSGIRLPSWAAINDTLIAAHVLDSAEPHGLKDLAAKYLGMPDHDEKAVEKVVSKARRIAGKLNWAICTPDHFHMRAANGKLKNAWKMDMWLPRQLVLDRPDLVPDGEHEHWLTVCREYAIRDAERTMGLWLMFESALHDEGLWKQYIFRRSTLSVLFNMECRGVPIRYTSAVRRKQQLEQKETQHRRRAEEIACNELDRVAFNTNSDQQVRSLLYGSFGLPVIARTKKARQPACDIKTLLKLGFSPEYNLAQNAPQALEFITETVTANKFNKCNEYLQKYIAACLGLKQDYATLRPNFNLTGTRTVRLSSNDPNGTNIGKGGKSYADDDAEREARAEWFEDLAETDLSLRSVFGPRPGRCWYAIDYSQLQLRIFAFISGEKTLQDAFAAGWDAHDYMAKRIYRLKDGVAPDKFQRRIAKNVNFGFIFGASPQKIEATAGRPGLWDEVIKMFPNAHRFMEKTKASVHKHGCVYTPGGYRLVCDKAHAGVNYIVQGSEGEIVQRAMIGCERFLHDCLQDPRHPTRLILQVHDELVFDAPAPRHGQISDPDQPTITELYTCRRICEIMEAAGSYYGMVTPVSPELVLSCWDDGVKIVRTPSSMAV